MVHLEEYLGPKSYFRRRILFLAVLIHHDGPSSVCERVGSLSLLREAVLLLLHLVHILQSLQDVKREVVQDYFT